MSLTVYVESWSGRVTETNPVISGPITVSHPTLRGQTLEIPPELVRRETITVQSGVSIMDLRRALDSMIDISTQSPGSPRVFEVTIG